MQKYLTQNKTRAFVRKLLKGSWQYVKEYCRSFISKITKRSRWNWYHDALHWIDDLSFSSGSYIFNISMAVAKMIWWVKNPFFGWILNINYFKKLNIFSDSHKSFKETHVVISDKRSHIFIVIVLLH